MADNIEWHEAGTLWGGVYRGGEAIMQKVFRPTLADIPDLAVTREKFMRFKDTARSIATPAQARPRAKLNLLAAGVWELHAGKIQRYRQLAHTTEIVEVARA